jgi:hypothetical protein
VISIRRHRSTLAAHALANGNRRDFALKRVPTIELRAGVVIGSGSASFEMLRYLTRTFANHDNTALG